MGHGDFGWPATWIVIALRREPLTAGRLLAAVAARQRPMGPGTLVAALARLERADIVIRDASSRPPMYRLTIYQREGA